MFKKRGEPEKGFLAKHKTLIGVGTLLGAIVGAGILAIPYVMAQSGLLLGFILTVILGLSLLLVNLMAGEIVLRTKKQHQLTGYAEKYLGSWGKRLMTFSMVFSIYGALTAYLIGLGETLTAIFHWGNPLVYTVICFAIGFFIIYKGVKVMGTVDFILMGLLIVVILSVTIVSYHNINIDNVTAFNFAKFFAPYGVILFALMGIPAVPEVQEVLGQQKEKMKKVLIMGSLIPIVLYLLFAGIVVGIIGLDNFQILEPNQRIATVALSIYSSPILGIFANLIAILAMFTSFLTLGTALIEMYEYDYLFSKTSALLFTFSVPLLIALLSLSNFITVIAITGAIAGGLEAILIIFTFWKARHYGDRVPEYSLKPHLFLGSLLILLFGAGVLFELLLI